MTEPVEQVITIRARPETVWPLLVEPAGLLQWWGAAEVDPRVGGGFRVAMLDGPRPVMRGEIVELVPLEKLVITFGWEHTPGAPDLPPGASTVTITLTPVGSGTELRLVHEGLPPDLTDETVAGWVGHLEGLRRAGTLS